MHRFGLKIAGQNWLLPTSLPPRSQKTKSTSRAVSFFAPCLRFTFWTDEHCRLTTIERRSCLQNYRTSFWEWRHFEDTREIWRSVDVQIFGTIQLSELGHTKLLSLLKSSKIMYASAQFEDPLTKKASELNPTRLRLFAFRLQFSV